MSPERTARCFQTQTRPRFPNRAASADRFWPSDLHDGRRIIYRKQTSQLVIVTSVEIHTEILTETGIVDSTSIDEPDPAVGLE